MSTQMAPPVGDLGRGHDISGKRFGLLTALRPAGRIHGSVVWLLKCDCGGLATRTCGSLNQAMKLGSEPQCAECLSEFRNGRYHQIRQEVSAKRVLQWEDTGSLWDGWQIEQLMGEIREGLCAEFGYPLEFFGEPPPWFFGISEMYGKRRKTEEELESTRRKNNERRERQRAREVTERKLGESEMREIARSVLVAQQATQLLRTGT